MSIFTPDNDTLITMARLVYEKSGCSFLNLSFSVRDERLLIVTRHNDDLGTSEIFEEVPLYRLVASYIGISLPLDLDANDAVTTGHRLGNTYR